MPSQVLSSVENNFTKGLVTEFTGLNFPENAATDADNCEFTLIGDVVRRDGIDYEENFHIWNVNRAGQGVSSFKWNNAGGDGETQVLVTQVGGFLQFWLSSSATSANPLSNQLLGSNINLSTFVAVGGVFDVTAECQFASGNGYLFVYHPSCDPFYCTYAAGVITGNGITLQMRDFVGIPEPGIPDTARLTSPGSMHVYNLINQGWQSGNPWSAVSTSTVVFGTGTKSFTVASGLSATAGQNIVVTTMIGLPWPTTQTMSGTVLSYSGTTLVLSITSTSTSVTGQTSSNWTIVPVSTGYINTWVGAIGNYPSNSDVWWTFKDTTGAFNPTVTLANVTVSSPAPKGSVILNVFQQQRGAVSTHDLIDVTTTVRPRTGCWFQGRTWYTGVDASFPAAGVTVPYSSTWTESIYFSQIITNPSQFGKCYQINDPTSETLFDLLPTDGGVIVIPDSGSIYKLFPLQNALLVFAANGVWYITGSSGIGFSANDYTIVKLSSVQSISSTSFVDVHGLPYFWNEEGIYAVEPAKQGTSLLSSPLHVNPLEVNPITVGTILSFYNSIPAKSKKFARGDYHPIDYVIQWVHRDTDETSVTDRYEFNKILNFNTYNKAFYPYTVADGNPSINGINYISSPGGSSAPDPVFKYLTTALGPPGLTFSEERDGSFIDWKSDNGVGHNYISYFVTGYKLHGQGQRRFQIPYIDVFNRADAPVSYKIQGLWDYATTGNSGRWSTAQLINIWSPNFGVVFRRHRIRGRGLVLQLKITSVGGQPFDIIGWSSFETQNTGI